MNTSPNCLRKKFSRMKTYASFCIENPPNKSQKREVSRFYPNSPCVLLLLSHFRVVCNFFSFFIHSNQFENKLILLRMFYILSADLLNENCRAAVGTLFFPFLNTYVSSLCVCLCALSSCKCFMGQKRNIKLKNA